MLPPSPAPSGVQSALIAVVDRAEDEFARTGTKVLIVEQSLQQRGLSITVSTNRESRANEQTVALANEVLPGVGIGLVGKIRVLSAHGVAYVGHDLQRVDLPELRTVALVEELDELAQERHRDLPGAAAAAVARDRRKGLHIVVAERDRFCVSLGDAVVRQHDLAGEVDAALRLVALQPSQQDLAELVEHLGVAGMYGSAWERKP